MTSPYDVAKVEAFMDRLRPGQDNEWELVAVLCGRESASDYVYQLRDWFEQLSPWEQANVVYRLTETVRYQLNTMDLTWTEAARRADDLEEP